MGYYTSYVLTILNKEDLPDDIEVKVARALAPHFGWNDKDIKELDNNPYPIDELIGYDILKWYDHTSDMQEIAKQFPECVFELDGIGEDPNDFWKEYYSGDKYQYCQGYREYKDQPTWI